MIDTTTVNRITSWMPAQEAVSLVPKLAGEQQGTPIAVPNARRKPAARTQEQKLGKTLVTWQLYNTGLFGAGLSDPPKPGDHITDTVGGSYLIVSVDVGLLGTVFDCQCRQEF